jgi:hypothetical protein
MSEIIEILAPARGDCPTFKVDTSKDFVKLVWPAGVTPPVVLKNAAGSYQFTKYDPFNVLSFGIVLPEAFTFWKVPGDDTSTFPILLPQLQGYPSGTYYTIPNFTNGGFFVPMENYEIAASSFVDTANITGLIEACLFVLNMGSTLPSISMLNAPAALNTKVLIATPFFKISHNKPL